jgi:hypothetical protein
MSDSKVEIAMRIPAQWGHPQELLERLPEGVRMTPEAMILSDGTKIGVNFANADDQFAAIFRSSCRRPPTAEEAATVDDYTVNALLHGPGGSAAAARKMMQAAAVLVGAGGAGVFIDNSAVAHGGETWLQLTDDGGADALSFAFVAIVGGRNEAYTLGMHVLGLRDVVMKRTDAESDEFGIIDVVRYMAASERPIDDGHILADLSGPRFQAFVDQGVDHDAAGPPGSPLFNPFGRLKIVSLRDVAEQN